MSGISGERTAVDAVLPLIAADLPRARLLAASLARFASDLGTLWIVAPDEVLEPAARLFGAHFACETISETELVPELTSWRHRLTPRLSGPRRFGYRAQQLIKLGVAERVRTPFYLTLDADVLAVRAFDADWLVSNGRARTVRFNGGGHRSWYRAASRILRLPESRWEHGVTPSVLSRAHVRDLLRHLEGGGPELTGRWRSRLLRHNDWTEYTLYHTFVEAAGSFDEVHESVRPEEWYGANVWLAEEWSLWTPEAAFEPDPHGAVPRAEFGAFRFCVLQSTAVPDVTEIERLVEPYLVGDRA